MKTHAAMFLATMFLALAPAFGGDKNGASDFIDDAIKEAEAADKPLLFLYTGNTWCPPCKAFDKSVVETDAWKNYAKDELVFLVYNISTKGEMLSLEKNFVDIKGDGENAQKAQEARANAFATAHRINSVPSLLLYDKTTKKWEPIQRKNTAEAFIAAIKAKAGAAAPKNDAPTAAPAAEPSGFIEEAIKEAKDAKKPLVFLYTGNTWCGPCQMFDKNVIGKNKWKTFARENTIFLVCNISYQGEILELQKNFKNIKGNNKTTREKQTEDKNKFRAENRISGVPTLLIYDQEAQKWKRLERGSTPDEQIKIVNDHFGAK